MHRAAPMKRPHGPRLTIVLAGLVASCGDEWAKARPGENSGEHRGEGGSEIEIIALEIVAEAVTAPAGMPITLRAHANFSDGSSSDVSGAVEWVSSDESIAPVTALGVVIGAREGHVEVTARHVRGGARAGAREAAGAGRDDEEARSDGGGDASNGSDGLVASTIALVITPGRLDRIEIASSSPVLRSCERTLLSVVGYFSDGTTRDLTSAVRWSSSDIDVARVETNGPGAGTVIGIGPGTVEIAAWRGALRDSKALSIVGSRIDSIAISLDSASMAAKTSARLRALGIDGTGARCDLTHIVQWASSDPAVAGVHAGGAVAGRVSAVSPGEATIEAALGTVRGSAELTVTSAVLRELEIIAGLSSVPLGMERPLRANGIFSDGSVQALTWDVVWTSSDPSIARVSNLTGGEGVLTAIAPGSVLVSAEQMGVSRSIAITVSAHHAQQ